MNLLITGATGFVGSAVLSRLIDNSRYTKIYLLVRSSPRESADQRVQQLIRTIVAPGKVAMAIDKLIAVDGDLVKSGLGLDPQHHFQLVNDLDQILHIGASTDFGAPLRESRLYNVTGTRHILELADAARRMGKLQRFDYVSTAFVAGIKPGVVNENELERGQKFANNYEQTKYEAEQLVRLWSSRIPTTIYRPSIIVGDSRHGYTPHFKVLYWPLRLLDKNVLPIVPSGLLAKLDIVPIDYVANALVKLTGHPEAVAKTFYLTAGVGNEVSVRELLRDAEAYADIKRRPWVPMAFFRLIKHTPLRRVIFSRDFWEASDLAAPYYHYLKGYRLSFDAYESQLFLEKIGVRAPLWKDYRQKVLRFCRESRWGKRLLKPVFQYYS